MNWMLSGVHSPLWTLERSRVTEHLLVFRSTLVPSPKWTLLMVVKLVFPTGMVAYAIETVPMRELHYHPLASVVVV